MLYCSVTVFAWPSLSPCPWELLATQTQGVAPGEPPWCLCCPSPALAEWRLLCPSTTSYSLGLALVASCSATSPAHHSPQWECGWGTRVALGLSDSGEFPYAGEMWSSEICGRKREKNQGSLGSVRYGLTPMFLKTVKTEIKTNLLVLPLCRLLPTCSPSHRPCRTTQTPESKDCANTLLVATCFLSKSPALQTAISARCASLSGGCTWLCSVTAAFHPGRHTPEAGKGLALLGFSVGTARSGVHVLGIKTHRLSTGVPALLSPPSLVLWCPTGYKLPIFLLPQGYSKEFTISL